MMTYEQALWMQKALLRHIRGLVVEREASVAEMLGSRYAAEFAPRPRDVRVVNAELRRAYSDLGDVESVIQKKRAANF